MSENLVSDFPDVRQLDHYSCGAAASMAVGLYWGVGPKTLAAWKRALGTSEEKSTKPTAIVGYFESLGMKVTAKQNMSLLELEEHVNDHNVPVIICCQDYGPALPKKAAFAYGHYLVVIGIYENLVICQDSSEDNVIANSGSVQKPGRIVIAMGDFQRIWHDEDEDGKKYTRYGIAIEPKESDE